MQEDAAQEEYLISSCPSCRNRLISGRFIVGGILQCPKCKRFWQIEMDANDCKVSVMKSRAYC